MTTARRSPASPALAPALALAGAASAGCFQPLYGERSLTGGPGLRQR